MSNPTFDTQLLTAATALNTTSPTQEDRHSNRLRFYVDWNGATTAGAVAVEGSPDPDFTRHATLSAFTQAANTVQTATVDGPVGFFRAIVTTAVVGGNVTVRVLGI